MKIAWMNDLHLDHAREPEFMGFLDKLLATGADAFLVAGDTSTSKSTLDHLAILAERLRRTFYFVLGNHDFYGGSITKVREKAHELCARLENLVYLDGSGPVLLTTRTALVGHDGWGDATLGDFPNSRVMLNDFLLIEELAGFSREGLREKLLSLGQETARHFASVVPEALNMADHVLVLTHVPPFLESTWYNGAYSNDDFLPFFSCGQAGEVLREIMTQNPEKRMTVLCGHTHGGGVSQILPNLETRTGFARYGVPRVQDSLEV